MKRLCKFYVNLHNEYHWDYQRKCIVNLRQVKKKNERGNSQSLMCLQCQYELDSPPQTTGVIQKFMATVSGFVILPDLIRAWLTVVWEKQIKLRSCLWRECATYPAFRQTIRNIQSDHCCYETTCEQQRHSSACTNVQADTDLLLLTLPNGIFSGAMSEVNLHSFLSAFSLMQTM